MSIGVRGLIWRGSKPRIVNSSPKKKRSKIGTPLIKASEFELRILSVVAKLPMKPATTRKAKTSGLSERLRRTGINCE